MFTNNKAQYFGDNKILIEASCLSGDSKPTTGIANGSLCLEMDTGKIYAYNEEDGEWEEVPSSGGGGGSSDFSIAKLTAVLGTGDIFIPQVFDNGENAGLVNYPITESGTYDIPLYKGVAIGSTDVESSQVTVSGNATYDNDTLIVTGDCTVTITA